MKIGDYVKFDNKLWEIIRIDAGKRKTFTLPDELLLNCKSENIPDKWLSEKMVEKTNISQSYFEL